MENLPHARAATEPVRQKLKGVRRGLLHLHKTLIDAERAAREQSGGGVSNSAFLQTLIHDPGMAWLQPFTGLIVEMDEALASRDEPLTEQAALGYLERVRALVEPEQDSDTAERYAALRQRDADARAAHQAVSARLDEAAE